MFYRIGFMIYSSCVFVTDKFLRQTEFKKHKNGFRNFLLFLIFSFSIACQSDKSPTSIKEHLIKVIDSLEAKIYQQELKEIPSTELTQKLLQSYEMYYTQFSEDTICAEFLFNSAQFYENIFRDNNKAIDIYLKIYNLYPDYSKRSFTLFTLANAYSNVGDTVKAIQNFKLFAEKFPKHDFADDALGMIKYLRMSEEQRDSLYK